MAFLKKKEKEICMSDLPSPPNPPPPWLGLTGGSLLPPHLAAADLALKRLSVAAVSYECCGGPASNWPWWPRAFAQLRRRQLSGSLMGLSSGQPPPLRPHLTPLRSETSAETSSCKQNQKIYITSINLKAKNVPAPKIM